MSSIGLPRKANLGCGTDIRPGYLNVDIAAGEGVDMALDFRELPWPLPDDHFEELLFIDILEHLPDMIGTIEELWRIAAHDAIIEIRVPHWTSRYAWKDPQHIRPFQESFFDYFDPERFECQQRPYYSKARFHIEHVIYEGTWLRLSKLWRMKVTGNRIPRRLLLATKLNDIVHFLQFRLRAIKSIK